MFNLAKIYNFDIIQPSLTNSNSCRIDHWLMVHNPFLFASKVSFIEVNMHLFKSDLLCSFLEYLIDLNKPILAGFGMDHLYLNFSNNIYKPEIKKIYSIIHGINVINPKNEIREIDLYEPLHSRINHFETLKNELNLQNIKNVEYEHAYDCLPELLNDYNIILKYKDDNYKIPKEFILKKPNNWIHLKFFEKIKYYATVLNEHYAKYVDKLEVKKIITKLGYIKTANIIKYMDSFDDLTVQDIQTDCIIKTTHASGWNIVVNSTNRHNLHLIIKKLKSFNRKFIHIHEKQYSYIKPRFYIEEIIDDKYYGKNGNAIVYMIRCIYGKAICINIKLDGKQNYYYIDWTPFFIKELQDFEKPKNLDLIIKTAEKLSSNFEFVRIDFHIDKNDDIYFSEFTFTPNSGEKVFSDDLELELGKNWI